MTVKQISIFLENRPESLMELTDILAKRNINMRARCLADTNDFGIARIIVDDPEKSSFKVTTSLKKETDKFNEEQKELSKGMENQEH